MSRTIEHVQNRLKHSSLSATQATVYEVAMLDELISERALGAWPRICF